MPLSPFHQRKFARMFEFLDLNRDGRVDRTDYVQRVAALARHCGWTEDAPAYRRNLAFALEEWDNLRQSADTNDDDGVSRAEFLRYADVFLTDRQAVRAYARGDAQLLFDAMDTDGDDRVTAAEYARYLEVCGADGSAAARFFSYADLDEDGRITRAEMAHAMEEFLLSEDEAAAGNYLFGPLDADA
jgi:Ca2+-binding EF-hand superfamily protein